MKSGVRSVWFAMFAVVICAVSISAGQKGPGARPNPEVPSDYPVVHVPKWQVEYTISASERYSVKTGGAEMYHQPSWHVRGTAIVAQDFAPAAEGASGSWSGRTEGNGAVRGETNLGTVTQGYMAVGSFPPPEPEQNNVSFGLSAKDKTYEISVEIQAEGDLLIDCSELMKLADQAESEARTKKDGDVGAQLIHAMRGLVNGGQARSTGKFRQTFSFGATRMVFSESPGAAAPTLSGSKKVKLFVNKVAPELVNAVFSWTITPYDGADDSRVSLEGCAELGVGQQGSVTAKGEPGGGTYRYWLDSPEVVAVEAQAATATLTAIAAGRSFLYVEYNPPKGKVARASLPVLCVRLESVNSGQPLPKIGLFDVDGNRISKPTIVPLVATGVTDLLSFKPANPAVLTVDNQGDAAALHGLSVGKTTFQASTECAGPTGPITGVEVVRCDDKVLATLAEQDKIIRDEIRRQAKEYARISGDKRFEEAAEKIDEATLDLALKLGSLYISIRSGSPGTLQKVKTAAEIIDFGVNLRDYMKGGYERDVARIQMMLQAAQQDLLGNIMSVWDTIQAADEFGTHLGALIATSRRLETLTKEQDNWLRLAEDLARRQTLCRKGGDVAPPTDPQPKPDPMPTKPDPPETPQKPPQKGDPTPPVDVPPGQQTEPPSDTPPEEPPPPQPPTPQRRQVALPYQEAECGCKQPVGIGADTTGLGKLTLGMENLKRCVEEFRNGPLANYPKTLEEWGKVYEEVGLAVSAPENERSNLFGALVGKVDSLLGKTKEFDAVGRGFHAGFEGCGDALGAGAEVLLGAKPAATP